MGFDIKGSSSRRKSVVGGLVEAFIDNSKNDFSITQLELLESLAEEVDAAALEIETEKEELESRITELENELEEMRNDN